MKRQRSLSVLLVGGLLVVAACGDDDDSPGTGDTTASESTDAPSTDAPSTDAPSTEAPVTEPPATEPPATEPPATEPPTTVASFDAFCQAEVDVEQAVATEDPEAIEPAFAALQEAAPEEISSTVETAISEAAKFLAEGGQPSPEFEAAYAEVIGFVSDNCGFATLDVLAKDYSFGGIGPDLPAGPTVINLTNAGKELHEIILIRKKEGTTESFDELLALPEKAASKKTVEAGAAFAFPGEEGHTVVDLEAGEYIALCFIPVGLTPEVAQSGEEPQGMPHFLKGMKHEFVVS